MAPVSGRRRSSRISSANCLTLEIQCLVGAPRIELGLAGPKPDVLPVYYAPTRNLISLRSEKEPRNVDDNSIFPYLEIASATIAAKIRASSSNPSASSEGEWPRV